MQHIAFVALVLSIAASAVGQQNWITNGDFQNGLTGWTQTGGGEDPKVEAFDTTGLGSTAAFGVNAGQSPTSTTPPPLVLMQSVTVTTIPYEFHADLAMDAPGFNNDAGTVRVRLGGKDIAVKAWGGVANQSLKRDILCVRFRPASPGMQRLELLFERSFGALRGRTPRVWIDNVGLFINPGPTFCFRGERRPTSTATLEVMGDSRLPFAVFLAAKEIPGLQIPGVVGLWRLELATTVHLHAGLLDGAGLWSQPFPIPGSLAPLQGIPLFFQPLSLGTGGVSLGIHHNYGLQK